MGCPVVTGGGKTSTDPLAGRTLRSWTWPFGKTDGEFQQLRSGSGLPIEHLESANCNPEQLLDCLSSVELETLVAKIFEAAGCFVPAHRGAVFEMSISSSTMMAVERFESGK